MQLPLLKDRYKTILLGACFQYVHGIFTQLAHRMHRPQEHILHDLGFELLPVSFWAILTTAGKIAVFHGCTSGLTDIAYRLGTLALPFQPQLLWHSSLPPVNSAVYCFLPVHDAYHLHRV